jgi:HlyD family secretion protein
MRALVFLTFAALVGVGAYYGYRWLEPAQGPPKFKTEPVGRQTVVMTVTATGAIEPVLKVLVGSQVSGTVMKWFSDFNDHVKEGDTLAILDQDRIRATLDQRQAAVAVAKARVEEAQARLSESELELNRLKDAFARSAASKFEVDSAETGRQAGLAAVHAAQAEVQAAEAELRAAQAELDKTVIRSPIDGVVISRDVDAGQTVAASLSAPTLFTIANDLRKMRVNAAVSETDVGRIREGMSASFRVDGYPERRFRGVVTQVRYAETVVDSVVTYQTLIDVDNADLALRPGMTATILFEIEKAEDVLVVPNSALRFDPARPPMEVGRTRAPGRGSGPLRPRVFTLGPAGLSEAPVELGISDGRVTQITGGELSEGAQIVVDWDLSAVRRSFNGQPRAF